MSNYIYKCNDCSADYSIAQIESELHYLCPKCGKAEKNQPLCGVLKIIYDYAEIKKSIDKVAFLKNIPGQFWNYPAIWPFQKKIISSNIYSLTLSANPIREILIGNSEIQLFDDTRNPTLSYKDRASTVTALKAMELGIFDIATASTGNAASSLAGVCAVLGLKSHVFVPAGAPKSKVLQMQSYGANTYLVKSSYDEAFDLCLEIADSKKWYNRNTAYNPLTIEGKKSGAYDIFLSSNGKLPDKIFVPVGDGAIIAGLYKGFWELLQLDWIEKMPNLIAVQAEGSSALVKFIVNGKFVFEEANTIADSISAGAPRNLFMAAGAVNKSNGFAVSVTDNEILRSQSELIKISGIMIESSCAASFAGYKKLLNDGKISAKEKCLLMLTGNGLKDVSTLERSCENLIPFSPAEWKDKLL